MVTVGLTTDVIKRLVNVLMDVSFGGPVAGVQHILVGKEILWNIDMRCRLQAATNECTVASVTRSQCFKPF